MSKLIVEMEMPKFCIWCENLEKYLAYDFFCHDGERKDTDKGEQ